MMANEGPRYNCEYLAIVGARSLRHMSTLHADDMERQLTYLKETYAGKSAS